MLLTDARRAARTGPNGELIPLDEQDRALWDRRFDHRRHRRSSREALSTRRGRPVPAAGGDRRECTTRRARAEDTDWPQILALYGVLERMSDNPMVALNRAIAAAMVHGPADGPRAARGARRRRADRRPLSAGRGARAPARDGGRSRTRDRPLSRGRRAHVEHSGAELPDRQGGSTRRPGSRALRYLSGPTLPGLVGLKTHRIVHGWRVAPRSRRRAHSAISIASRARSAAAECPSSTARATCGSIASSRSRSFRPSSRTIPPSGSRFTREAQTSAQLSHPHIVPIYDVGERDGIAYFVMALVHRRQPRDAARRAAATAGRRSAPPALPRSPTRSPTRTCAASSTAT